MGRAASDRGESGRVASLATLLVATAFAGVAALTMWGTGVLVGGDRLARTVRDAADHAAAGRPVPVADTPRSPGARIGAVPVAAPQPSSAAPAAGAAAAPEPPADGTLRYSCAAAPRGPFLPCDPAEHPVGTYIRVEASDVVASDDPVTSTARAINDVAERLSGSRPLPETVTQTESVTVLKGS